MTIFRQLSTSAFTFFVFALIELSEKADACKSQATKKRLLPELRTFHDSSILLFPVFLLGLLGRFLQGCLDAILIVFGYQVSQLLLAENSPLPIIGEGCVCRLYTRA
jgi:hypothetical protein